MKDRCLFHGMSLLLLTGLAAGPEPEPMAGALSGRAFAAPMVLDRILVVVNGQPITKSRLEFFRAYLEAMDGGGLGWPRPIADVRRLSDDEVLEILVIDELLFEGGSRVEALRVREKALSARMDRFRAAFPGEAAYLSFARRYELTPDVLREFFSRRLRVEGYIELKVGSERPAESELQEYYLSHRATFGEQSFEEVKGRIASLLYAPRAAARFESWIAELRERANVQVPARER